MQTRLRMCVGRLMALALILLMSGYLGGAGANAAEPEPPNAKAADNPEKAISFDLDGGARIEMLLIPAGSFLMGDAAGAEDEQPQHRVTISRPFYLGKYPVTQRQWEAVMGNNPSEFKGPDNPVESVGWVDCEALLEKLNRKFAGRGVTFGLPTEAQWEYACRAGSQGKFCFGDAESRLGDYAWFRDNAAGTTHPVGAKKPNAWGLYDMHGNVLQWCTDSYSRDYYQQSPATDPICATWSYHHVVRGGCWEDAASNCRAAYRNLNDPSDRNHDVGLRVTCVRSQ